MAIVDAVLVRAHGGRDKTGPNPIDRGKPGTKYTHMVDKAGAPLAIRVAGANASDQTQIQIQILTLVALGFPQLGGRPGRPRQSPDTVYADAGYDSDSTRGLFRCLGMEPRIRRRGTAHGSGLGRVRWVVERTISWLKCGGCGFAMTAVTTLWRPGRHWR